MSHEPYLDWLLDDQSLSPEQQQLLSDHLKECESCHELSIAWREAESELRLVPMQAPQPGFTTRWQDRLAEQEKQRNVRHSAWIIGLGLSVAAVLLGILVFLALPVFAAPRLYFWAGIYRLLELYSLVSAFQNVVISLARMTAGKFGLVWWIFSIGLLTLLCSAWFVSFRILTKTRRVIS
jgi:predicted anti-sigma-YlaC factor YlaD